MAQRAREFSVRLPENHNRNPQGHRRLPPYLKGDWSIQWLAEEPQNTKRVKIAIWE